MLPLQVVHFEAVPFLSTHALVASVLVQPCHTGRPSGDRITIIDTHQLGDATHAEEQSRRHRNVTIVIHVTPKLSTRAVGKSQGRLVGIYAVPVALVALSFYFC